MVHFKFSAILPLDHTSYFLERDSDAFRALLSRSLRLGPLDIVDGRDAAGPPSAGGGAAAAPGAEAYTFVTRPDPLAFVSPAHRARLGAILPGAAAAPTASGRGGGPHAAAAGGGGGLAYTDVITYDPARLPAGGPYTLPVLSLPPVLAGAATVRSVLTIEQGPDGPGSTLQTLEGDVEFRLPLGVGRLIEAGVTDNLRKVYAGLPAIGSAWAAFRAEALALPRGAELLLSGRPLCGRVAWVWPAMQALLALTPAGGPAGGAAGGGGGGVVGAPAEPAATTAPAPPVSLDGDVFFDAADELLEEEEEEEEHEVEGAPPPPSRPRRWLGGWGGGGTTASASAAATPSPPRRGRARSLPLARSASPSLSLRVLPSRSLSRSVSPPRPLPKAAVVAAAAAAVGAAPPDENSPPPVPPAQPPTAALWFAAGPASPSAALAAGDAAASSAAWRQFWDARGLVPPRSAAGAPGASARSLAFMLGALDRGGGAVASALCCGPGVGLQASPSRAASGAVPAAPPPPPPPPPPTLSPASSGHVRSDSAWDAPVSVGAIRTEKGDAVAPLAGPDGAVPPADTPPPRRVVHGSGGGGSRGLWARLFGRPSPSPASPFGGGLAGRAERKRVACESGGLRVLLLQSVL